MSDEHRTVVKKNAAGEPVIFVSKKTGYDGHREAILWCKKNGVSPRTVVMDIERSAR